MFAFVLVHVSRKATNKGFVNFNFARKLLKRSGLHRLADSMKQEPRAFLSDANAPVNLTRANAVLGVNDQPNSSQPLVEADRAILHDGSQLDAKMLFASLANPNAASLNKRVRVAITAGASDAIRPADRNHAAKRGVWIGEVTDCLNKCFWECLVHDEETLQEFAV
jgi:hypothetical protein